MTDTYWERRRAREEKEKQDLISECDSCGKLKEVKKYGKYTYCQKCKDEVDRGN